MIDSAPFTLPLSAAEFREALRTGHGRALMHVRRFGDAGLESELEHALTSDLVYDMQVEGSRVPWLMLLLDAVADRTRYRRIVLHALSEPFRSDRLRQQMLELGAAMAPGDAEMEAASFAAFERRDGLSRNASALARIDGLRTVLRVAEIEGTRAIEVPDGEPDLWFVECDCTDDERRALRSTAASSASIARALESVDPPKRVRSPERRKGPKRVRTTTLEEMHRRIEATPVEHLAMLGYPARFLPEDDATHLFRELLTEESPDRLVRLLHCFRVRQAPELHRRLFELAESPDARLRAAAFRALTPFASAAVRDAALRGLKDSEPRVRGAAADALIRNFLPGDKALFIQAASASKGSECEHDFTYAAARICDGELDSSRRSLALRVYNFTGCGSCRASVVTRLKEARALPDWLIEEVAADAMDILREEFAKP